MELSPIHERLRQVTRGCSFRQLGAATGVHPETVRRYMHGHAPSVEFLASVCAVYAVNGDWLLTGRGSAEATGHQSAPPPTPARPEVAGVFDTIIATLTRLKEQFEVPGASELSVNGARTHGAALPISAAPPVDGATRRGRRK